MNRNLGNDSASPVHAKLSLMRKSTGKRPPLPRKRLSESAATESIRSATRDPPSKLAGLSFGAYKRAGSKTVPASGRSMASISPVDKNPFDKAKRRRVLSGMAQIFFSPFIFSILAKHLKPRVIFLNPNPSLLTLRS